MTETEFAEQF